MRSHRALVPISVLVLLGFTFVGLAVEPATSTGTSPFPSDAEFPPSFPPVREFRTVPVRLQAAVFFPPAAPVFGVVLSSTNSVHTVNGVALEPPDDLGRYVGEFFYPALSTRLLSPPLDPRLARQLDAYLTQHAALLNELQDTLVVLQTADAATRERELRAFAAVQTPRLVAHEKEAEDLREKLIRGKLFGGSVDWSKNREWKLGDSRYLRASSVPAAERQVVRAAAYYQDGLSVEQRGLLCEIVERERPASLAGRFRSASSNGDPAVMFFSPETARLRLPDDLPRSLVAKIDIYARGKDALKEELRRTVVENDRASDGKRLAIFQKLAEQQWPRLSALADLAEEIRRELTLLPVPPPPPLPPQIPPPLLARLEAYRRARTALDQERRQRGRTASLKPLFANLNDLANLTREQSREQAAEQVAGRLAQRASELRARDEEFLRENADRYQALDDELHKLSAELLLFAKDHLDPDTGDPMDLKLLFARVTASERHFDQIAREEVIYKNYRIAMLEPGLSPEQRRLLFGGARVELAQALPPGEMFPTRFVVPFL